MAVAIAGRLAKPVWFDTGLRMQDGTPRTIAAYDQVQLKRYKERVTDVENERGEVVKRIPWVALSPAAMAEETQKPVEGVTSTTGRKSRNG